MPKSAVMTSVSRPLIALLVATAAFFAVWTLALKPSGSSSGGSSGGVNSYQSAIDKAHQAVATSDAASAAHGGTVATTPTSTAAGSATASAGSAARTSTAPSHAAAKSASASSQAAAKSATVTHASTKTRTVTRVTVTSTHAPRTAAERQRVVNRALAQHKVVAVLFYNQLAADDTMVRAELATVPTHHGRVVKLAVPLVELTRYPVITTQVPITGSPTLVLIDGQHNATTIVGFTDTFEIARRVDVALKVKPF